jgi:hypothetical protein
MAMRNNGASYVQVPSATDLGEPSDQRIPTSMLVDWRISYYAPTLMVSLLLSGIGLAVGHHVVNTALDHTPVKTVEDGAPDFVTQKWIGRYGIALAFLTKTLLAGAVTIAYKQHIWLNFRRCGYTIDVINALYDATNDFSSLLNVDMIWNAKSASLLALFSWWVYS